MSPDSYCDSGGNNNVGAVLKAGSRVVIRLLNEAEAVLDWISDKVDEAPKSTQERTKSDKEK